MKRQFGVLLTDATPKRSLAVCIFTFYVVPEIDTESKTKYLNTSISKRRRRLGQKRYQWTILKPEKENKFNVFVPIVSGHSPESTEL